MLTAGERWLAATWPLVRSFLPLPPARVVDLGCGSSGGFVPALLDDGYDGIGVDPKAPAAERFRRVEFERAELPDRVDAVVASTSLHHVTNPGQVIDRIAEALTSGGTVVVVEWAWEQFNDQTAEWGFARLGSDREPGWLHRRHDSWLASGQAWSMYLSEWARREGLHRADQLVRLLDERFERRHLSLGPYLFADLPATTHAAEQAAIDAGEIKATRILWVGSRS